MARGPLYEANYRPLFSGHETFPLRHGWLKKAYDAVKGSAGDLQNKRSVFLADDAIARFGVGKNMVSSIRHWAESSGVIEEDGSNKDHLKTTQLGDLLFGDNALDPYMESPITSWLVHWNLVFSPIKTTSFWAFNNFNLTTFRRDDLVLALVKLAATRDWRRAAETTVRRDVECFVRTYVAPPSGVNGAVEDSLESPLAELSLVRLIGRRDDYQFVRGAKRSLTPGVFVHALNEFWKSLGAARTLSFEMIAYEPRSPGRIFLLDEADLALRLGTLESDTGGAFRWSETAGLKQVIRLGEIERGEVEQLLARDYGRPFPVREAA